VTPPELSPLGPFVAGRYLPTLAAYPGNTEFEWRVPDGLGPARVGLNFTQILSGKIAPFETKQTTPATHAKPEALAKECPTQPSLALFEVALFHGASQFTSVFRRDSGGEYLFEFGKASRSFYTFGEVDQLLRFTFLTVGHAQSV
jgi:hypothetical protein